MADENLLEIVRQTRLTQDKHTTLLLTAAGAAIGLVINQTQKTPLSPHQVPLALAVLFWGISFCLGCKYLSTAAGALVYNAEYIKVKTGQRSGTPFELASLSQTYLQKMKSHSNSANAYFNWPFRFLIIGAVFYLGWHVLEMYFLTHATL